MQPTPHILLVLCVLATLPLLGCGGGGSGSNTPAVTESITLNSDPDRDGRVSISGIVDFSAAVFNAYTGDRGADVAPSYVCRQLYAFDLGDVPAGARIVRATLRLYQARVVGNPYSDRGDVIVDHVDYVGDPGLDSYDGQDLSRNIGTISTTADEGYKTLDVTAHVAWNQTAGDSWSQFRLRFWRSGLMITDGENDYANFIDGENDDWIASGPPELVVVYEP